MSVPYAQFFANQSQPELLPNELALYLSRATAHDHFRLHRAMLSVNPVVLVIDGSPRLTPADAALVLHHAEQDLLGLAGLTVLREPTPSYQLAA